MAGDANFSEVLSDLRRRFPDVPERLWRQIEAHVRSEYGSGRVYVERHRTRRHLDTLEHIPPEADARTLADMLGVTVRHARRLKNLR